MERDQALVCAIHALLAALRVWLAALTLVQPNPPTDRQAEGRKRLKSIIQELNDVLAAARAEPGHECTPHLRHTRARRNLRRTVVTRPSPAEPTPDAIATARRTTTAYGLHPPPWPA